MALVPVRRLPSSQTQPALAGRTKRIEPEVLSGVSAASSSATVGDELWAEAGGGGGGMAGEVAVAVAVGRAAVVGEDMGEVAGGPLRWHSVPYAMRFFRTTRNSFVA